MTDRLGITCHIKCPKEISIEKVSREIALEQTVELPDALVKSQYINDQIIGSVSDILVLDESRNLFKVVIHYNPEITGFTIPQFLNLLYGNISIKNFIKITNIDFPALFLKRFKGPRYGIVGIRNLTGVYGRPLLSTALKPMGSSPAELAAMTEAFARGGGDIIKDDHGLVDHSFCTFKERVSRCQEAADRANAATGFHTLYFPNITDSIELMEERVEFAIGHGVSGILMSPFLTGPDYMRYISDKYNIVVMAHPAFTGANFSNPCHGMTPAVLLGTIFRLSGADISIYPNTGGRFSFTTEECIELNNRLREPLGELKPAFPSPAGGMNISDIDKFASLYGEDIIYLIGGALHGYSDNLTESVKAFMERIKKGFSEYRKDPDLSDFSSCEVPVNKSIKEIVEYLPFLSDYRWKGRSFEAYKDDESLEFRKISRQELIGKFGEKTAFDLRYFQIETGGYSSLEKHIHEHVIICLRGDGIVVNGDLEIKLKPFDIAYVPPMRVHQLLNRSEEPFGFLCIVDHERDRPMWP